MVRTRKEYPEFSTGIYRVLETSEPAKIFAHACQDDFGNAVIAAHNLTDAPVQIAIKHWEKDFDHFIHLFDERANEKIRKVEIVLKLPRFGFSWLRLRKRMCL
jgi:maltose alpha-D-glucosyltransferase / alpha-amylase